MPKRDLTKYEKAYLDANHETMTSKELCSDMKGIGVKAVEEYLKTSVMPKPERGETVEQRREKLEQTGLKSGDLMARAPERGLAIMTPGASELADVNRNKNVPTHKQSAKAQSDKIFIPKKDKDVY